MPAWWGISFLIWLGYGVFQWRGNQALLVRLQKIPASQRTTRATLSLIGGAVVLVLAFWLAYNSSAGEPTFAKQAISFCVITLGGLAFVHLQTMAAALIIAGVVTPSNPPTSDKEQEKAS